MEESKQNVENRINKNKNIILEKNIQMYVIRKFKKSDIDLNDIISDNAILNEFKLKKYNKSPIKYIFEYIHDMYVKIHIYIIFIFIFILLWIFIKSYF